MKYSDRPTRDATGMYLIWFILAGVLMSRSHGGELPPTLRIVPPEVALWGKDSTQRLLVLVTDADGFVQDVTTQSEFSLSDPTKASVDSSGKIRSAADGDVVLTAELSGQSAQVVVHIQDAHSHKPFHFRRDIAGIFTKHGCNTSDCHGSVKGKGGFKLSSNGTYPREDYQWVVQGGTYQVLNDQPGGEKVPRIDLQEPERSLLLLKPTTAIDHGGGFRFDEDSFAYQTILDWIRSGAPYEEGAGGQQQSEVERIEVYPSEVALERRSTFQLLTTAHLSHGRRDDYTESVSYSSVNEDVVTVNSAGVLQAVEPGESTILIRSPSHVTATRVRVIQRRLPDYPDITPNNFIDVHVFRRLEKWQILPSALATDDEFLRRVCLDIAGTLPPPERARQFLADEDIDKREKLIEILLDSPEYVDYWTFRLADLFQVSKPVQWRWVHDKMAADTPYDQLVRERVASQGYDDAIQFYLHTYRTRHFEEVMSEDMRLFLGRRFDCAQCHNHPFDMLSQNQFWGLAAFFGRMTNTELRMDRVLFDDRDGQEVDYGKAGNDSVAFRKPINPRTKTEVPPTFLDGRVLPDKERDDPRRALADWMTSHPYFAETMVNRMWSYFFGRGLVEPVDDFRVNNPPTHPQLLADLAQDFTDHGYKLKHLVRLITNSRTYQLSSIPNETNKADTKNYSLSLPRPLEAEVLLDAICHATGVPLAFVSMNPDIGTAPLGTRAIQLKVPKLPGIWSTRFLEVYGQDSAPNLAQALHTLVGSTYTDHLSKPGGRIGSLMTSGKSNRVAIEEFYLATLSRYPTEQERDELEHQFGQQSPLVANAFFAENVQRKEALEDLLWALVCSREFAYNH